jgi:hypothetical protein
MKDWRAIAQAYGLRLSVSELDRIEAPLDALEEAFRPLVSDLTPDLEPCVEFSAEFSALLGDVE